MDQKPILYFDCVGGVSGDMTLGALLDLGVYLEDLTRDLKKLKVRGFQLNLSKVSRSGVRGTRLVVETPNDRGHRHFSEFADLIENSRLSPGAKTKSLELFRRIFAAEAKVHGKSIQKIHLHELGSLDTLVDVVGTVVAMELLGHPDVECSPVNMGGGIVNTEHGVMPVPAPATARLLGGVPVFSDGSDFERTTPTGALLVTGFASRFGPWPNMTLEKIGYGVGSKDSKEGRPNFLRLALGKHKGRSAETVLVMETTVDDMTPEVAGHTQERLLAAGALDVFITPVQMKKNRPGMNLTVIAEHGRRPELCEILFAETTTLGLRVQEVERQILERKMVKVKTRFGMIAMKLGLSGNKVLNVAPEYEDCRRIASAKRVSLKQVQHAAIAAFQEGRRA